jgi:hypothetical protein
MSHDISSHIRPYLRVAVAAAMPRRSLNSPTTASCGVVCLSCAGLVQLLLRAVISPKACTTPT